MADDLHNKRSSYYQKRNTYSECLRLQRRMISNRSTKTQITHSQLGKRNIYWAKLVKRCHISMCMIEPKKYKPYVPAKLIAISRNVWLWSSLSTFDHPAFVWGRERYTVNPAHHNAMILHIPKEMMAKVYVHFEPWGRFPREQISTTSKTAM